MGPDVPAPSQTMSGVYTLPKIANTPSAIAGVTAFVLACERHAWMTPELTDAQIERIAAHLKFPALAARLLHEPVKTTATKGITDATKA